MTVQPDPLGDDRPGRATIRDLTTQLLLDGVPQVQGAIYSARAWPLDAAALPALLIYMFNERKQLASTAGGGPEYTVSATLAVHARAEGQTEAEAEGWLDLLAGAIETTLLNDAEWMAQFERIPAISTEANLKPGGDRLIGEAILAFELEWTERFPPIVRDVLRTVQLRTVATDPAGAAIGADLTLPTI